MDSSSYFTFQANTIENLNNVFASKTERIAKLQEDYATFMLSQPDMNTLQMGESYYMETLQTLQSQL
jgi:uncharacterized coiled-coil protein SlyX